MADRSGDAELLASELVANAAEHADGNPISLALQRIDAAGGQSAVRCEVSGTSPALPRVRDAGAEDERGRGLAIFAALASACGVQATESGKTTWFTLAVSDRTQRITRAAGHQAEPEAEAGA